jgi:hypothetical protein
VPIKEGDRVRTPKGLQGKVELMGGRNTLAYVQLDEDTGGPHFDLYESLALTKIGEANENDLDSLARRIH